MAKGRESTSEEAKKSLADAIDSIFEGHHLGGMACGTMRFETRAAPPLNELVPLRPFGWR